MLYQICMLSNQILDDILLQNTEQSKRYFMTLLSNLHYCQSCVLCVSRLLCLYMVIFLSLSLIMIWSICEY